MLIHASELVTCKGGVKAGAAMQELHSIPDGALLMENGIITMVGTTESLLTHVDAQTEVLDVTGKTVLPGFVDSHTHFVFGGYRAEEFSWRLKGESYMEIMNKGGGIASSVSATRAASLPELVDTGRHRLNTMLSMGITTVEGKSGYGLDHETELKQLAAMEQLNNLQPVEIATTFMGAHAIPLEYKGRERAYLDYLLTDVMPEAVSFAEFADIFCEKGVFSREDSKYYLQKAKDMGFSLKLHADEIVNTKGAELGASLGAMSADHLLKISEEGIKALAQSDTIATLLPLTAFSLAEEYANGRALIDAGCKVALATDFNPGSCFSQSIPLLISLACIYMHMSVEEVVTALTINGAAAIHREDRIGSLEPGKQADLVILEYPSIQFLPYHAGMNIVETVVKKGNIVYRKQGESYAY